MLITAISKKKINSLSAHLHYLDKTKKIQKLCLLLNFVMKFSIRR